MPLISPPAGTLVITHPRQGAVPSWRRAGEVLLPVPTSIRFPPRLKSWLEHQAKRENSTVSRIVVRELAAWQKRHAKRHKLAEQPTE